MGKTLITYDNIDQFVHGNTLVMDSSRILTAGARDELIRRGIEVAYDEHACTDCGRPSHADQGHAETCPADTCHEDMLIGVAATIKQHYGITNSDELRRITLETVRAITAGQNYVPRKA